MTDKEKDKLALALSKARDWKQEAIERGKKELNNPRKKGIKEE